MPPLDALARGTIVRRPTDAHWLDTFLEQAQPLDAATVAALESQRTISAAERRDMWSGIGGKAKANARRA